MAHVRFNLVVIVSNNLFTFLIMNKSAIITWVILLGLTIISALFSSLENKFVAFLIIVLAAIKFLGVAFQFMELKKAHSFWKGCILSFIFIFITVLLIMV